MKRSSALPLLVAATMFMEQLDGTILVTALPSIAGTFGVTAAELDLSVSAYLVTLAFMIPASGWIADRFGAKRVFAFAIVLFILSSILCGVSQTVWQFIGARILQGLGGAIMVPVGRLIVLRETEKSDLIRVMAYLTWPALSAPLLGPPLGGYITTYASWHWIFYVNAPFGLLALCFVWKVIPQSDLNDHRKFDAVGFGLTGLATLCLLFGIELLGRSGISALASVTVVIFGLGCAAAAVWRGLTAHQPIIAFDAFRTMTFRLAMRGGGIFRTCLAALPFLLPLLFQVGFGLDPVVSGTLVLGIFAGNLGMKPATSWILRQVGFRRTMLVSGIIGIATIAACAMLTSATSHPLIVVILFVSGLARSMQYTTLNTLAFSDVPKPLMGSANTLFSMQQQSANAFGVAIAGALLRVSALMQSDVASPVDNFQFAFLVIAIIATISMIDFYRVSPNAGDALR